MEDPTYDAYRTHRDRLQGEFHFARPESVDAVQIEAILFALRCENVTRPIGISSTKSVRQIDDLTKNCHRYKSQWRDNPLILATLARSGGYDSGQFRLRPFIKPPRTPASLLERLKEFLRRPFVRNVMTVASGTALSQAIAMAFSPLITRLYGPEAFGLQGVFMSVVALAATVAALSYPTAIVLPKSDADAKSIALLSVCVGLAMSLLTAGILFISGGQFLALFHAEAIAGFMFLIPVAMIASVFESVLGQWLIRKRAFGVASRYGVATTFLMSSAKSIAGLLNPTAMVLIAINAIGNFVSIGITFLGWRRAKRALPILAPVTEGGKSLWESSKAYRDFPLLRTPQNLINNFSQGLPVLLLAGFFGPAAAGQYGIALAVLGMPAMLIGGSVMSVFYPRINKAIHQGEDAYALIIRTTLGMAASGALPFIVVLLAGPFLFGFVFGAEWHKAGVYAQLLSPWLFLQYVNKPAVAAMPALKLQGGLLIYELFSTGTKLIALWIGFSFLKSDVAAIGIFSLVGAIAYAWLILWVLRRSAKTAPEIIRNL